MGLDKVKKRYEQVIKHPAEVKEVVTSGGKKVRITTTNRTVTVGEALKALQEEHDRAYKDMGFSMKKLREAGFDPDRDDPDDFCHEGFEE